MKLYPPIIKGTIPAFCDGIIKVPFEMNKSVSISQVKGFSLLLKTVQTNTKINDYSQTKWEIENNIVTFDVGNEKINVGQFYKLQLAYIGYDGIVGHYSTVGIIKCTSSPTVEIEVQDEKTFNGLYKQTQDFTEKVYSYNFSLFDSAENLIETSGDLLHNSSKDADLNQSVDNYTIKKELEPNTIYYLKYSIKTINGLEKEAKAKKVVKSLSIDSKLRTNVKCSMVAEEGYVDVNLVKPEEDLNEASATGSFYLLRASDEDNFSSWSEVLKFVLYGQQPSRHLWKDMTVKQGVTYRYAVQQYNSEGLRSNKIISNDVYADFEHAFLYDGERQLKIKYNPKISSFKNTLLESKTETIGSKYPFIFRNGNVSYKEFPISGLISYLSDENKLFFNTKTDSFYDVNLTSQNLYLERQFKLEVLNWLNNGKPKLFRSPGEGNYIVRLMNNSLSPIDSTGRMLHTFNCTAYEIAENNYDNLKLYDFVNVNDPTTPQLRWLSVDLSTINNIESTNLLKYDASSIRLEGMIPGDKIIITMSDETTQSFVIGATGSYIIDLDNNVLIKSLELQSSSSNTMIRNQGVLTYSYYSTNFKDSFDTIVGLNIKQVPCQQFIGEYENIIDEINNFKEHLGSIVYLKFILRDAETEVYQNINGDGTIKYYSDPDRTNPIDLTDTTSIYKVYDKYERDWDKTSYYWLDGYNNKRLDLIDTNGEKIYHSKVVINNDEYNIDLEDTLIFELKNPKNITSIKTGSAVICEIGYQSTIISYNLESTPYANQETIEAKENYNNSLTILQNAISNSQTTRSELKAYQDNCKEAFNNYCKVLDLAVQEAERR